MSDNKNTNLPTIAEQEHNIQLRSPYGSDAERVAGVFSPLILALDKIQKTKAESLQKALDGGNTYHDFLTYILADANRRIDEGDNAKELLIAVDCVKAALRALDAWVENDKDA